jgi:hypothetical protein
MPADQSGWFDNHQSVSPVEAASEPGEHEAVRSCGPSSSLLTLLEQPQLLMQKQILGDKCCAAAEKRSAEADAVSNNNLEGNSQP